MKRLVALALSAGLLTSALVSSSGSASAGSTASRTGTPAAIHVVSSKKIDSRRIRYLVSTPSLALSTTTPLRIDVLLPVGYAKHPKKRYPVLYAFPGTASTTDQWFNQMRTVALTAKLPVIVVVVDGGYNTDGGGFYTNWVDQTTTKGVANWETFHINEALPWVESRFRIRARRGQHAIVGISQGGFGSMSYAMRHASRFGIAAAFSGAVDIYQGTVCTAGASSLIAGIMTSQNQVQPFAPFGDPATNATVWKAHDPGSNIDKLRHTKVDLYVSQGQPAQSDLTDPGMSAGLALEAAMHQSNQCFKDAADAAGYTFGWHDYAVGLHSQPYMDRDFVDYLPRLMRYFAADTAKARRHRR